MSYENRKDLEGYTGTRYNLIRLIMVLVVLAVLGVFWMADAL